VNALVTGSSGFLGRHFVAALEAYGWQVTGVDVADPNNPRDARDLFRESGHSWDLVVHCAAVVNGRQVIERSPMDQVVDFELDAGLFQWALRNEVSKVVFFSSSAAYPIKFQKGMPYSLHEKDIDLSEPALPDALYGWTKLTGEVLAKHALAAGLDVLVVRPFSGYGSDQDDCYPFPAIIQRALRRDDPFIVWGSGKQVRDFIHVDDIVEAVLTFVDCNVQGPINIGTGRPTSMSDLAKMAAQQVGYDPQVTPLSSEPEGVMYRVADIQAMNYHYQAKVSLEAGIARALREMFVFERIRQSGRPPQSL
jgi:nucleoside-diphosphate-sugar epimerase